jgi:RimJ/RimL family protein N-acetyltransferase
MDPVLLDIPQSFESKRLSIRAPRAGDGPVVNAGILESFDALHVWMPWAKVPPSVAETEKVMRECAGKWALRTDLTLLLFRKDDGDLVGGSGLHLMDWSVPRFEIGYWVRRRYEGQGFIVESTQAIARFAFDVLRARRVEIRCDARNARSVRVAERAGFLLEGRLRNQAIAPDGAVRDTVIYALTDADRAVLDG